MDSINDDDINELEARITSSAKKHLRYKKRVRRGIAGSVLTSLVVLLGFGTYAYITRVPSIEGYVNEINIPDADNGEITLVLDENEKVAVHENYGTIAYSNTGKKVKIGSEKELEQSNRKDNKIVYNTLVVPYGKRTHVQLSDGSQVWLNSGSKLTYPVTFTHKTREVYLEGEGIFDVAHNKEQPFVVLSQNHQVKVLGTVFNLSSYPEDNLTSTTLKSGSVEVTYRTDAFLANEKSVKITPGTQTSYSRNHKNINTQKVDVDTYFSWKDGILVFNQNDLKFICKKLSRYYNVDISIPNEELENITFSGKLDLRDDIQSVIELIQKTATTFEYQITADGIEIN